MLFANIKSYGHNIFHETLITCFSIFVCKLPTVSCSFRFVFFGLIPTECENEYNIFNLIRVLSNEANCHVRQHISNCKAAAAATKKNDMRKIARLPRENCQRFSVC